MHVTSFVLALVAVGAHAAPAPEPQPWCWRPGQPCWIRKRAADAFAEAVQTSGGLEQRAAPEASYSNAPGGAAYKTKRSLNELAHLAALTARSPEDYYNALGLDKEFESEQQGPIEKRKSARSCARIGQGCWKRDTSDDDTATKDKKWCDGPGQACWKSKRAATAVLKAIRGEDGGEAAKDAHDVPFKPSLFPPECNGDRILCWKKREASPEANPAPWCWRPGQPCWMAKRDLHALEVAARSIVDES